MKKLFTLFGEVIYDPEKENFCVLDHNEGGRIIIINIGKSAFVGMIN